MRYYSVAITGGTATGPYSIYYNSVINGNLVYLYPSNNIATGLTYSQLQTGVTASTPTNATSIIIYNTYCGSSQTLNIGESSGDTICLCMTSTNTFTGLYNQYYFCTDGTYVNSKPKYTTTISAVTYNLTWNSTNKYWEVTGLPPNTSFIYRTTDPSNTPISPWVAYGTNAQYYVNTAITGSCTTPNLVYNISCVKTDADCSTYNNGSIISTATGGYGGWVYSLDGVSFTNTTGIFMNLGGGTYNVYAKDIGGTITYCSVYIAAPQPNVYQLPMNIISNTQLGLTGNMMYYKLEYVIDTSFLPNGISVTFNNKIGYSLNYLTPGSASFNTSNNVLYIDSTSQTITQTVNNALASVGASPCNVNYSKYGGYIEYKSNLITVDNTNTVTGYVVFGIDTITNGITITPCLTKADLNLSISLENITINSICESVVTNTINESYVQYV